MRERNGKLYFRKTITDELGNRHWLERRDPFPEEVIPDEAIEAIFKRFPEPHTAFLPLYLVRTYHMDPEAVYEARIGLYASDKAIQRQVNRITQCSIIFGYTTEHLIVNLKTGKPISSYQRHYISRVIRKEIYPEFTWKKFAKNSSP